MTAYKAIQNATLSPGGRIKAMAVGLACSVLLLVGASSGQSQAQETVVFAGWGGSIQAAQRQILFDAFEQETGIRVIDVPDVNFARIRAMVESGNVQWDVVQPLGMWVPQGEKENMWEPIDYDVVDASGVPEPLRGTYGLGNSTYGMVLAYNKDVVGDKRPGSWEDFWDTESFDMRRGMHDAPRYALEIALLADGVPIDEVYPPDVDHAFNKLDDIKPHIHVWWTQWPQVPVLLASREIGMSLISHTRILSIIEEEGVPLDINWNQGLMTVDFLAVPRGAPNSENAMRLIDWMTRADLQAELARETGIGPSNAEALALLTEEEQQQTPSYHYQQGNMLLFDNEWWAENQDAMAEKWNAWKLR